MYSNVNVLSDRKHWENSTKLVICNWDDYKKIPLYFSSLHYHHLSVFLMWKVTTTFTELLSQYVFKVLYSSISIWCKFILLLHFISEVNIVLFYSTAFGYWLLFMDFQICWCWMFCDTIMLEEKSYIWSQMYSGLIIRMFFFFFFISSLIT